MLHIRGVRTTLEEWQSQSHHYEGNDMNTARIAELEALITRGLELRKRGYQIKIGRQFIMAINSDLRSWNKELAQLQEAK